MVGAFFCPICQIFLVWFHYTMFRRLCCFRLTTVPENCHSDTLHKISRHKLATVFWNSMCEISLWPVLNSNVVYVSLSGGSLGYWTACNNFKRHCTLPYCDYLSPPMTPFISMGWIIVPGQNSRHFADCILRCIFVKERSRILFVP